MQLLKNNMQNIYMRKETGTHMGNSGSRGRDKGESAHAFPNKSGGGGYLIGREREHINYCDNFCN